MNRVLFLLILILPLASCINDDSVVCTMEFVTIGIQVTDSLDNPVKLDDYYTINNSTKEELHFKDMDPFWDSINVVRGYYTLATDSERDWTNRKNLKVTFYGFIDSVKVIEEEYIISDDICHIYLIRGKQHIVLE